ncbi:MAG: tripartite tricarboxylate transporter substrate-binding protein [Burkholderiaceae bacterium]
MFSRRSILRFSAAAGAAWAVNSFSQGRRPITIVVGYAPGGSPDFVARLIAERLQGRLGRPVIVENKSGANGQLALAAVQNAAPDGSTYALVPPGPLTIFPSLYRKLAFDGTLLQPILAPVSFEHAVATSNATRATSLADFLALAKSDPGKALFGVPAAGSPPHFVGLLLGKSAGIALQPVVYRGGPPMLVDLMGNQVPLAINVMSNFVEHHRSGKLRVLATTGNQRSALLQDVPTLSELGFKQATVQEWYAFVARKDAVPAETAAFVSAAREVVQLREVRAALLASGHAPADIDAQALAADIARNRERWSMLIKEADLKVET